MPSLPPREVIAAIDLLVAKAGMVAVICIDQLDGLIAITRWDSEDAPAEALLLDQIANGLMDLAQDFPQFAYRAILPSSDVGANQEQNTGIGSIPLSDCLAIPPDTLQRGWRGSNRRLFRSCIQEGGIQTTLSNLADQTYRIPRRAGLYAATADRAIRGTRAQVPTDRGDH